MDPIHAKRKREEKKNQQEKKNVALRTYIPAPKGGVHARHLYYN